MKKRIPAIILMFALFLTTSYAANTYRKTITVVRRQCGIQQRSNRHDRRQR